MDQAHESVSIARTERGALSSRGPVLSVSDLERSLLAVFSKEDALPWDKTGLSVGNPSDVVKGVAIALDPTVAALEQAADAGANVLVAHHPLLLNPPDVVTPFPQDSPVGAAVWTAIRAGVSVMSFHTALDANPVGLGVLPHMLKLEQTGVIVPLNGDPNKGFGALCRVSEQDKPLNVGQLAARCTAVFGRAPRVWANNFGAKVETVACATGSAGDVVEGCLKRGVSVLVCGEIKYHAALDAQQAGLVVIELGHDVSELPLCAALAQAVERAGLSKDAIRILDQSDNWCYPEATRI